MGQFFFLNTHFSFKGSKLFPLRLEPINPPPYGSIHILTVNTLSDELYMIDKTIVIFTLKLFLGM